MLEIWGRRNASNVMPVMWAVGELGLEYARHDVGGSFGGTDASDYLALNPNGRIPTIRDDGFVMWESNAIVRYLCRRYSRGSLCPEDEAAAATCDQWMEWHKTTPYPPYIDLFWAVVRTEPALRDQAAIARLSAAVGDSLAVLEAHLAGQAYVCGDHLTMADIPLGPLTHRYFALDVERPALPNMTAWYERLRGRPAFREHVIFPYGSKPAEWYLLEREGAVPGA